MGTKMESLILAQPNSPLQYPIQGFVVAPLAKSVIPGKTLSFTVKKGVLSVEDVLDGDQVEGQGQSNLTISSSSRTHLNDLLSRVTYTSTIYHVKTKDLGNVSTTLFVHYRSSVPVLYDPGTGKTTILVTITTKTFLRYDELNILINSIRQFYPKIKIIIADDSLETQNVTGYNLEHYIMPPAQGWFAGRNLAISQVTTKYILWVDDDYIFNNNTRIESFVEIMEKVPELDVVSKILESFPFLTLSSLVTFHQPLPNFKDCFLVDGVVNNFLGRTGTVRRAGFDPYLKRVGHSEFFMDGLGQLLVASCKGLSIGQQRHREYSDYTVKNYAGGCYNLSESVIFYLSILVIK
uniref:Glycosyltransferase 2-like domain-containing protein n=1 Tax=Sinocyclocheilus rhinocerous TaxID=307959 RepID=A0A673H824_9TELE